MKSGLDKFVTLNVNGSDLAMHYRHVGQGIPVLLIHGLGSTARQWRMQEKLLSDQMEIWAPTLPGFGDSPAPIKMDQPAELYSELIAKFIEQVIGKPVILVGHSLGGGISIMLASARPDLITKMILVSPAGLGRELNLLLRLKTLPGVSFVAENAIPAAVNWFGRRRSQDILLRLFVPAHEIKAITPMMKDVMGMYSQPSSIRFYLTALRAGANPMGQRPRFFLLPLLRELKMPTIMIWGDNDRILPTLHALRASQVAPDIQVKLFRHCGHSPHLETPLEFASQVREFALPITALSA